MVLLSAPAHALPVAEVVAGLGSDAAEGLNPAEAQRRLVAFGPNSLTNRGGKPAWLKFLLQFNNPLLITLLVVGAVKALLGHPRDALVIWSVTVINAVIGFVQESKAESAIAALARAVRTEVEVVRGGVRQRLPSELLVVGDLVRLEAGARVPADLRLVVGRNLHTDESALTGESVPVGKGSTSVEASAPLAERIGMAYAGSYVTSGQGMGLVVACGDATEVGRISTSLQDQVDLTTPLTRKFGRFSRTLLQVILVMASLTFLVGLARGRGADEMFDGAVALAVGAIPEELPAIVTITLAIGVHRMARRRAIIRKLPAVEALGSTTVICSDKTGTLTQNRMTVQHLYAGAELSAIEDLWPGEATGSAPGSVNVALQETLLAGLLCNDARPSSREGLLVGDPTETALLVAAKEAGIDRQGALDRHPRRDAIPFESEQQFMATLHGSERILLKGSVEVVLGRCSRQLDGEGQPQPLDRRAIEAAVAAMAARGERVLAFAIGQAHPTQQRLEHHHVAADLDFLGLQGMLDPPRPEAILAVAACQAAGITVKMITGDHVETARAIAREMGIGGAEVAAIDGRQLEAMAADGIAELVDRVDVFARVAPAQKLQLVQALQANGEVVAMTGDGVNDAPALKQADIGIAMGAGGTEVAREAADMLLTDDNFATIEAAVEEGRTVYLNLRKTLAFVLPVNGGASMTILLGAVLGTPLPVTALQVLWLNMICSLTMSIALAFEPIVPGLMQQPPRPPNQPLLTGGLIRRVLVVSLFNWALIFGLFFWSERRSGDLSLARTMAVQGLVLAHLVYLVSISQLRRGLLALPSLGWRALAQAPAVPLGIAGTITVQWIFSQTEWMNRFFDTAPLDSGDLLICALPMLLMLPVAWLGERLDPTSRST
ncbi:HAD-IC family P-type ATPase [Synechococcus sp. Cruz-9H2]|uniref:cation-translocating P-type ATPase n=1 Tax=unclassified Synechococcus TaxID=2626047 RepID=UPI0020CE1092|nr:MULTISPECIES: HAD-IC family P-type ATPase [unclassified Synechococcus]MCP9820312.1 HAD-IC family P-type ATPase [Synechococcus sp. Cruz-9H2]MCP9844620.1 HAD-IC family P-type ATPase [Synechococcus sp. Edmonson 11F2]MCP9856742.1 HAD-IC family P-type ATPase [Synechococcus sp. Cruz-9C9]MCP9864048.1 HAD-IC family P-type ATPase [Synechococcus sp. Cruz-7E5]MCP9871243.1 HAD-IC family P-type ATPase [Synechococcus sp. Cruz-7B9]